MLEEQYLPLPRGHSAPRPISRVSIGVMLTSTTAIALPVYWLGIMEPVIGALCAVNSCVSLAPEIAKEDGDDKINAKTIITINPRIDLSFS